VVQANASWVLETLDEACDVIVGVLADYARPISSFDYDALQDLRKASQ